MQPKTFILTLNFMMLGQTPEFVFTVSDYTFQPTTQNQTYDLTITGTYSYNSNHKLVYLNITMVSGKTRTEDYAGRTVPSDHYFVDDDAARAAETNYRFSYLRRPGGMFYNTTNKTIGWGNN